MVPLLSRPLLYLRNILKLSDVIFLISAMLSTPALAIVKGSESPDLAKYSVMVLDDHGEMCSAAILSQTILLTAAHCIAHASDWRIHWRDFDGTPILIKPEAVRVHPSYDPAAISKRRKSIDLALIKLSEPLPERFQPIELSRLPALPVGEMVTVAGFGFSEEKNRKTLGKMRSVNLTVVEPYGPSQFVLWMNDALANGAGGCQGDSGGPILYQGKLFALVSWSSGEGKSNCGYYTQGVILFPELDWINSFDQKSN